MNKPESAMDVSGWLGLDVGGTFTDLVLIDDHGVLSWIKTPSTPSEPGHSTLNGVDELISLGVLKPKTLDRLHHVHGTTLATNTVIERRGATLGLITTEGFRDLLELQRLWVPNPLDFTSQRPEPLVPRAMVREIPGRIDASGREVRPLDAEAIRIAASELVNLGAQEIVVCFVHSFINPEHEKRAVAVIEEAFPDVAVHSSAEIWPQAREFERATLALINAYVRPKISAYIQQLRTGLADRAISTEPRSARSNGGIERSTTISQRPVVSLLSGPAAGIAGALHVARQAEWNNADLVTLDVGGTSADIGVIRNGAAVLSSEEHIADFPVLLPTVAVSSIGAGGGSIIWVDDAGALKVGPRSLGADPAPACYGHQKDVPALTDAFLLAGWLGEAEKLGGKIRLNAEFARSALASVATALNCSIEDAADGAISIGIAMMASETMRVLARRGVDAPEFRLVAFGGAGPLVGGLLAEEVHISSVLIPPAPGALSALGAALADVESDFVHPVYSRISELDAAALSIASKEMERRGEDWLVGEGQSIPLRSRSSQWSADMRYDGQGYDVSVPINREWLANDDLPAIAGAFHQSHKQTYGHASLERQVWLKELRLHVIGSIKKPTEIRLRTYGSTGHGGRRTLRIGGQEVTAAIYPRDLLDAKPISGPAVIDQLDSTTLVPPGWTARAIGLGSLLLERTTA